MKALFLIAVIIGIVAGICFKKSMKAAQQKDNCRNLIEVYGKQIRKDIHVKKGGEKKKGGPSQSVSEAWSWKVPATLEELRKAGQKGGRLQDVNDELQYAMGKMSGDFNPQCEFVPTKEAMSQGFYTIPANKPVLQCKYHQGHTVLERDLE